MALTSSIYDHFIIWPSSVTLTVNLCKQMIRTALLLLKDNNRAKLFWNPCTNVPFMAQTSSIYDHFDLYLTPMMALLLLEDNYCAIFFWNPCINVQVMAWTSSIYDHFDLYLTPVTFTFNLPEKIFQMSLLLLEGNNCKIILKSMHKCTSYGSDKFNTCIWPFWPLFDPCDLDLQPT